MYIADRAIPLDSTVVVVGANGHIAVETCHKLLEAGYRVRGMVRDVEKHRGWMSRLFDEKWPGKFELVQVADFEAEGAFDEAFKGASGVIYPSMPIIFKTDLGEVAEPLIKGVVNTLAAAACAGVQRYVLSSTSKAVDATVYGGPPHELTVETFNHGAVERARRGQATDTSLQRIVDVYSAGRTLAELAFWDWLKENNPPFVANCIVPDGQFGRILDVENMNVSDASATGQLRSALEGNWQKCPFPLAFCMNVQDSARLLIAAVASAPIRNERIFAYRYNRTWNDMRKKARQVFPDRPELVKGEDQNEPGRDLSSAAGPIARAEEILRSVGQPGFASEESIIRDFVGSMYA